MLQSQKGGSESLVIHWISDLLHIYQDTTASLRLPWSNVTLFITDGWQPNRGHISRRWSLISDFFSDKLNAQDFNI